MNYTLSGKALFDRVGEFNPRIDNYPDEEVKKSNQ